MKKYLLVLAAGIFGILTANAWTVSFSTDENGTVATITSESSNSNNWGEIKYPTGVTNGAEQLLAANTLEFVATDATKITSLEAFQSGGFAATTVDFSGAVFYETDVKTISYEAWNPQQKYHAETVTKTSNCMTFSYFPNVSTAVLANVTTLCQNCFANNKQLKTTFIIPETVEYIAAGAVDATPIGYITIPATVKYIESEAFKNADIEHLSSVVVKGYTYAENGAFAKIITVGQTDADYGTNNKYGNSYAVLSFPEGAEEFFQNFKEPLTQAISLNKGKFQAWLNDHHESARKSESNPHGNGWHEFINSSPGDPYKVPEGPKVVLRTFSDNVARLVPLDFRAYLVNGVHYDESNGGYVLSLVQIFAIPANTGVILYGEIAENATGFSMSHIAAWDDTEANRNAKTYVAPYTRFSGTVQDADNNDVTITNYMVPAIANTKIYPYYKKMSDDEWKSIWNETAPTTMEPYYTRSGDVTDRNFIMTDLKYTTFANKVVDDTENVPSGKSCNYVGFFRTQKGLTIGGNKAYLSIPNAVVNDPASFEGIVLPQTTGQQKFRAEYWNNYTSTGNWGPRGDFGVLKSKVAGDEIIEDATGIDNVNTENVEDNNYYTLQGVKVVHPQKGVYIKNGKKVILK